MKMERRKTKYEKVGFKIEGRLKNENYIDGVFHDTIIMGRLL